MKLKYIGMLLITVSLVTVAAAVPAQQGTTSYVPYQSGVSQPAKSASLEPSANRGQSGNIQDIYNASQIPAHDNNEVTSNTARAYYGSTNFFVDPNSERGKLMFAEDGLARQANSLKAAFERAKSDEERTEARAKLRENLGNQFDMRQKRHAQEIEALETQVKKLKELVRKRQESREDIITRRVDQIVREIDGLGW